MKFIRITKKNCDVVEIIYCNIEKFKRLIFNDTTREINISICENYYSGICEDFNHSSFEKFMTNENKWNIFYIRIE